MTSPLGWQLAGESATQPAGMVACGPLARVILAELGTRAQAQRDGVTVVATRDMLVLLGPADKLPWRDGVRYCAPHAAAPALWLPTDATPTLPADLVLANLAARGVRLPFLLWDSPEQILPLDQPIPLDDACCGWLAQVLA